MHQWQVISRKVAIATLLAISLSSLADQPATFSQAKRMLEKQYAANPVTFYCGCRYASLIQSDGKKRLTPDAASCGLKPRKNAKRAARIEWEHVVPAWEFGHQLQCWQKGGRKACRNDPMFLRMEADMNNIVPAVGELNGDRSNFRFGMIEGEPRLYGACDFEVDFKQRVVEPRPEIRGEIARIYFYMEKTYGLKISDKQRKLFEAWLPTLEYK